jgi:Leucine-rich repeat (LRR) protein
MSTPAPSIPTLIDPKALEATIAANLGPAATVAMDLAPEATISPAARPPDDAVRSSLSAGIVAGGYTLGAELGRGGLGQVNLATQNVFERTVAVKRLLLESGDRDAVLKFYAEAVVTAGLAHPNIVPIYDLAVGKDGKLQLVMKCVEGTSWRDLLHPRNPQHHAAAAQLTLDDHLDILLKSCDAVSFAHGRGILHRDIKPENVMIGSFGEVQVMDWGCAVAFGSHRHPDVVPRKDDITLIAGTPAYMAPEMIRAEAASIGPHSDVYLLGATLYEVLTLSRPHQGETVYTLLASALKQPVEPPAQRSPLRDIPDELGQICLDALAAEISVRIPTVAILSQRLKEYRTHAQAAKLATTARKHLASATSDPAEAGEHLRKAIGAVDHALAIWPAWTAGQELQARAVLAYAQYCLDTGAYAQASTSGSLAATLSAQLPAGDAAVQEAHSVVQRAARAAAAQAARQRTVRRMRTALAGAAVLIAVGLAVGIWLISAEQRKTATERDRAQRARGQAESALQALTDEQRKRAEDQRTFAPALLAQARKALDQRQFDGAAKAIDMALSFDPQLVGAHALRTNLLASRRDYAGALASLGPWLALAPADLNANRLKTLCTEAARSAVVPMQIDIAFGELFTAQRLFTLAEGRSLLSTQLLYIYKERIERDFPSTSRGIAMVAGDTVATPLPGHPGGFADRADIVDLAPLEGIPFSTLTLTRTGITDLKPLSGMPIEHLFIDHTRIAQLQPLADAPLNELDLSSTQVVDLAPLKGRKLHILQANGNPGIASLLPLTGMPLEQLDIGGSSISDLTPLKGMSLISLVAEPCPKLISVEPLHGMPLTVLHLGGGPLHDLSPLRGMPLLHLVCTSCTVSDLSPLKGMAITTLDLSNTQVAQLAPLTGMPLDELWLGSCPVKDLSPLDGMRLRTLGVSGCPVTDLTALRGMQLRILFLNDSAVTDLNQVADLPLETLCLQPFKGRTWLGLERLRSSKTLRRLGPWTDHGVPTAAEFWKMYDNGDLTRDNAAPTGAPSF